MSYAGEFHAKNSPESIALADSQQSLSFGEVEQYIHRLSAALNHLDLAQAARIAILAPNSIESALLSLSIQRLGLSAAFLNVRLTPNDWLKQLSLSEAAYLFYDESLQAQLPDYCTSTTTALSLQAFYQKAVAQVAPKEVAMLDYSADREAVLIFTSGSTGQTKGVCLSLGNLAASAAGSNEITGLSKNDTWLISLPLYHLSGLGVLYRTLYAGARAFFIPSFSDQALINCLSTQQISHLSLVPTQLDALIQETAPSTLKALKAIILAGAPSSPQLLQCIEELQLPVLSAYGMTETTAHCCCMRLEDPLSLIAGVGRSFSSTEIEVVDNNRKVLACGILGEIRFRGPTVCLGYITESTAPNRQAVTDADGWLYSGDLGVLDAEGNLTIKGRRDSMFISGGENMYPAEIEHAATAHPAVAQAAVIAIDDETWGKRPVLFYATHTTQRLSPEELSAFLHSRIAKIKVPKHLIALQDFPLTAIGKNDYPEIKRIWRDRTA